MIGIGYSYNRALTWRILSHFIFLILFNGECRLEQGILDIDIALNKERVVS